MSMIRKDDLVCVIKGASKGKVGKVLEVIKSDNKLVVEGVNSAKIHKKPSQLSEGGILTKFLPIHVSNVMLVDPKTNKPTRVKVLLEKGKKKLVSIKTGEEVRNV